MSNDPRAYTWRAQAKAILGGLIAGLAAVAAGLDDAVLSAQEWVTAAVSLLTAYGAVFRVTNRA